MLTLKSACERCNKLLEKESKNVYICSYECTFCEHCSEQTLLYCCPNCKGELVKRPRRIITKND